MPRLVDGRICPRRVCGTRNSLGRKPILQPSLVDTIVPASRWYPSISMGQSREHAAHARACILTNSPHIPATGVFQNSSRNHQSFGQRVDSTALYHWRQPSWSDKLCSHGHDCAQCQKIGQFHAQHLALWKQIELHDGVWSISGFRSRSRIWVGDQCGYEEESRRGKGARRDEKLEWPDGAKEGVVSGLLLNWWRICFRHSSKSGGIWIHGYASL